MNVFLLSFQRRKESFIKVCFYSWIVTILFLIVNLFNHNLYFTYNYLSNIYLSFLNRSHSQSFRDTHNSINLATLRIQQRKEENLERLVSFFQGVDQRERGQTNSIIRRFCVLCHHEITVITQSSLWIICKWGVLGNWLDNIQNSCKRYY